MEELREDDPRTLGPFTLRSRLGAGGMGVVYLADTDEGTEVAVKTVPRGVGQDVRVRLQREADLLKTIDHPRIARFVDADAEADEPWLAMRYVSGPSLSDADLPLPPQQLRQLADGLAEALSALHKLGVTHRDVKPGNIIMTTHGAVLVDLGIAVTADAKSMTMAGTAVGSPAWMAPEQFAGDPAGPPADVWGWAAVLTYAATGHEPFGTGSLTALAHRIMSQPPNLQDVPEWLVVPVRAALTKAPDRRPTATDLLRGGRARVPFAPARASAPVTTPGRTGPPPVQPPAYGPPGGRPATPPPSRPAVPSHPSGQQVIGSAGAPRPANPYGPPARRDSGPSHRPSRSDRSHRGRLAWIAGAVVVVAAVVVALVLVLPGSGGSGGDPTSSPTTGSTKAAAISESTLQDNGLCAAGCTITGRVAFTHPSWGAVTLVTAQGTKAGTSSATGTLAIFDSDDQLKWQSTTAPVYTLKPVSDPVDALTHIFLSYTTGRYPGIVVLSADNSTSGMTDYTSIPVGDDSSVYRFYDSKVQKASDGRYEILKETNDCTPDCASGTVSTATYSWDGAEYSTS